MAHQTERIQKPMGFDAAYTYESKKLETINLIRRQEFVLRNDVHKAANLQDFKREPL
jgi:hypothetical protein